MRNDELVTMKDGRQYRRTWHGSLERVSIVKMSKKERRKLYAKLRAESAAEQTYPVLPVPDIDSAHCDNGGHGWEESDERKKFLADIEKEW
jgi:hypothetical protein